MSEFNKYIVIDIARQTLRLLQKSQPANHAVITSAQSATDLTVRQYAISTAKNGIGNLENSGCTPLGWHTIAQKIGDNAPINSVFVARKLTGEIYSDELAAQNPERDWILTRILWLDGCEQGVNKGVVADTQLVCDTLTRYIYIHGTPDTEPMGVPLSHGCIRMRNQDIIELYDRVEEGTPVFIIEK